MKEIAVVIAFTFLMLAACSGPPVKTGVGTLRYEIFQECMRLAALSQSPSGNLATHESETSELVSSCSLESMRIADQITRRG